MQAFDEQTLRKLEQLSLVAARVRVGLIKGDRRSRRRGSSVEFADYRDYVQGDDLRRLDWNVYARLEKPFIKLLEEEEDLAVHLLLDASASMNWPVPAEDNNKLVYGKRITGALGHIALSSGDQLTVSMLKGRHMVRWGPHRGHRNSMRLFQFLSHVTADATTDLNHTLRNYAIESRRPGLLLLVSDLFSPSGFEDGLRILQARGYEIGLLHVLCHDEVNPSPGGDVRLIDIETGAEAELTLDHSTVAHYTRRLQEWRDQIAAFCNRRDVHYIPITTDLAWDKLILQTLRTRGLVR